MAALVAGLGAVPHEVGAAPRASTSCTAIAHIGDSISVGMSDEPYERIGARDVRLDVSGARSAIERHEGRPNAVEAAEDLREDGFDGCWVIAIGTNDAANVAAGSSYGASERIDRVMEIVGDDPVLWVDAKTTTDKGFYADENMRLFNQALAKAHARHPTLEVFRWSEVALSSWFSPDGIHYTSTGYARRAALIAAAVAEAFPASTRLGAD